MIVLLSHALLLGLSALGVTALAPAAPREPRVPTQQPPLQPETPAPDPSQVLLHVGRVEITRADLDGEYERLIPWNFFHGKVPEERRQELRLQARDSLIEKALIFQDAQDRPISVTEEDIRGRLTETLSKAGPKYADLSAEQFEMLFERYRPDVLRRILIDRNEARFDRSLKPITEDALKARFAELESELFSPASASFQMIQIDVDPAQRGALLPVAHLRANELRKQLVAGASFDALAKEHSGADSAALGGDLGFVTERTFPVPEVGPPAFLLKDGEISEPLESIYGVHLVRRLETRPRRPLAFEEARPQLLAELEHVQRKSARRSWLDGLRERYEVSLLVDIEGQP